MMMANYLKKKGKIERSLYGVRVDIVFIEYAKETLKEKGYCGVWLWLTIISFFLGIIISFMNVFLL
jgi:hypothetical protein